MSESSFQLVNNWSVRNQNDNLYFDKPCETLVKWGNEIYFDTSVSVEIEENAKEGRMEWYTTQKLIKWIETLKVN